MSHKLLLTILTTTLACAFLVNPLRAQNNPKAGTMSSVQTGTITTMTAVTTKGDASLGRTIVGGAAGGALGNQVGGGSGKKVATAAGAILGARRAKNKSAERNTQKNVEFLIKLENGQTVSVVQSQSNTSAFKEGDTVNVITAANGTTRITRS